MLSKYSKAEIEDKKESFCYYDIEEFNELNVIYESGIALFDKDDNVSSVYKCESKDDTINTMKKVIAVCELGEEEITKFNKVRYIIKDFLEICFRKKFTVFALSMAFIWMFFIGVKERMWAICLMYTWGFFTITETSKAIRFIKEKNEEYKLRDEALKDDEFMMFFNNEFDESIDDVKVYTLKKNK